MELEDYLAKLDKLQEDGAFAFIKWDGERRSNRKTVLIEKPGTDYLFRRDTDNLLETLREGVEDYNAYFSQGT